MELSALLNKLESYKPGTFIRIVWRKNIENAKARKENISIVKESTAIVRLDCKYSNLNAVIRRKTATQPEDIEWQEEEAAPKRPVWFEYSGIRRGIVQSKSDPNKKYLQVFPAVGKQIKTCITMRNVEYTKAQLFELGYINKSEMAPSDAEALDVFTLSIDNIVSIGE